MADDSEFVELNVTPASEGEAAVTETPPAEGEAPAGESEGERPAEGEAPADGGDKPAEGEEGDKGDKGPDGDDPLRDDKGRYKGGAAGRINELTRARREAERAADYWKGIATQNGAKPGEDAAPTSKPKPDDFEDYGEYVEALTDWKVGDAQRKATDANVDTAEKAVEQHRAAEWGAKIGAAKATIADFDAVMEKADTPTLPHVANAIMDADRGPELLYHLAGNPEIVERLNEMSPYRAAMELGRIEATLEGPAEKPKPRETTKSKAPAPITPVQPGSSTSKDPAKMSQDEYNEWRAKQLKR